MSILHSYLVFGGCKNACHPKFHFLIPGSQLLVIHEPVITSSHHLSSRMPCCPARVDEEDISNYLRLIQFARIFTFLRYVLGSCLLNLRCNTITPRKNGLLQVCNRNACLRNTTTRNSHTLLAPMAGNNLVAHMHSLHHSQSSLFHEPWLHEDALCAVTTTTYLSAPSFKLPGQTCRSTRVHSWFCHVLNRTAGRQQS